MAAKSYKALSFTMTIDSFYCDRCKKMIIDTEISRYMYLFTEKRLYYYKLDREMTEVADVFPWFSK